MDPAFFDNELFLVNRFEYLVHPPERFDVVQVIDPFNNTLLIKRVIGLPGEMLTIKRGKVFIQHSPKDSARQLDESDYINNVVYTKRMGQKAPLIFYMSQNEYFIMGDNREQSTDSRVYGPVSRTRIVGKIIVFPWLKSRGKKP